MKIETFISALDVHDTVQIIGPMPIIHINRENKLATIYVDGGINHSPLTDALSISIGDNDSNISQNKMDIELQQEKSISDLDAALEIIPEHIKTTYLRGFSGGRVDHQMINIGSVHHFLKNRDRPHTCLIDEKIKAFKSGKNSFFHKGIFSLMTLEKQKVRIYGECKYEIKEFTNLEVLTSLTLSNIGSGEVHIECELPLFIYFN